MLSCWCLDCQDNAISESGDCLFKLDLQLVDKLGFTPEPDLIGWLIVSRAVISVNSGIKGMQERLQSNQAGL
jgi:hypothetical protein